MILLAFAFAPTDPHQILDRAFAALGGRAALASIAQTQAKTIGHTLMVEQSERPAPPFLVSYEQDEATVDFASLSITKKRELAGIVYGPAGIKYTSTYTIGTPDKGSPLEGEDAHERFALGPERILRTAESAKDLRTSSSMMLDGVKHQSIEFHWGRMLVRVWVNDSTNIPDLVETEGTHHGTFAQWGDIKTRTRWTTWSLQPGGIRFPLQWAKEMNGLPLTDTTYLDVKLTRDDKARPTPVMPFPTTVIDPKQVVASYRSVPIADGIVQYAGPYNTASVDLGDSIFIIEPVGSSQIASELLKLAPQKPVSGVFVGDDAWFHFAGARTFAARGIPIYSLDLNAPILRRYIAAKYQTEPDELAKNPQKENLVLTTKNRDVGKGPNRMVFFPIRGQIGERVQCIYFPEKKLLYSSDLLAIGRDRKLFFPQYGSELMAAAKREGFEVETVFGMYLRKTPWADIVRMMSQA